MRKTRLIDNVVKKLIDSDTKVSHDTCRRYKYLDTAHLWLLRITVRPPFLTPFKFLGTPLAPATKIIYQEKINIFLDEFFQLSRFFNALHPRSHCAES